MKRSIFLALIALCAGALSFAVPLTASWIEGDVFLRVGSGWKEIQPGDKLDSASTIRLGLNSFAEFSAGARKIAVTSEGTFNLDALLSASASQAQKRSNVVDKMGRMVAGQAPRSTVVAGVRGDFEGAPEKTNWAVDDDDPETLAEEAEALLSRKQYAAAAKKFGEAASGAIGDKRDEYAYSQAWALAAAEDAIGAIKVLRPMKPSGAYAVPRAILLARLSLDTGAARDAAAVLDEVARRPGLVGDDAAIVKELREEARQALVAR